jgi:ribosome maturation factor RimP
MTNLEQTIEQIVVDAGALLYDIELVKEDSSMIYRIYITNPNGGVSLDLCAKISNLLSPILDTNPPTSQNYYLEVSSPGLERKLTKPLHFTSSIGSLVKYKYDGEKYKGTLTHADDDGATITIKQEPHQYTYDQLSKVKTYIEW